MASLEQLAAAHGFTLEELALNRDGKLDPKQVKRGGDAGRGWGVFFIILAVLVLGAGEGGAAAFFDSLRKPPDRVDLNAVYMMAGAGLFFALCFLAVAIAQFRAVSRRRAVYAVAAPEVVEGPVQKVVIQQRRQHDTYRYRIGGRDFAAPEAGWKLIEPGVRYRAYSVAGDLLSIEPLP
ncbi:MAG: hypothetical protein Q8L48_42525 [Archangium sp.]|nr:hypothetical protein [Archangium sp.]